LLGELTLDLPDARAILAEFEADLISLRTRAPDDRGPRHVTRGGDARSWPTRMDIAAVAWTRTVATALADRLAEHPNPRVALGDPDTGMAGFRTSHA
jgi:hypothetical protein